MAILFFYVGSAFFVIGLAIIYSELKSFAHTTRVLGQVVGYASVVQEDATAISYRTVVQFRDLDSQIRYVVSPVGSSAPLKSIGQEVPVRLNPSDPEVVSVESSITLILGGAVALMGGAALFAFWKTFSTDWFSLTMAFIVTAGVARTVAGVWRKKPLKLNQWNEARKNLVKPEVFLESDKDQIPWVDPAALTVSFHRARKNSRRAIPICFVLGLAALGFGFHSYQKTNAFLTTAGRVEGQVAELEQNTDADGSMYAAIIEYSDPGTLQIRQFKDSMSASHPLYSIGEKVQVLVDPNQTERPQIDRGIWNYFWSMLCLSVGLFFLWAGFHAWRALRRLTRYPENPPALQTRSRNPRQVS